MSRNFYISVTQQVLLFGAEYWVLTVKMEAALDAFQGRVARRLMGRMPHRGRDGKWVYLPLAGGDKGRGDSESKDIGPPETEYGRAIRCGAADSGTLCGDGATGGGTGPSKMVGTARDQLEAGAGEEGKSGGCRRKDHNRNCRDDNSDARDGVIGFGKGIGGGGVTGGQWLQWGGMERGGRLRHTLFFRRQEIHGTFSSS